MRFDAFEVAIPQGAEHAFGYVTLADKQVYTIKLTNHDVFTRCNAELSLDGKPIGTFRLEPGQSVELEHSIRSDGRFTFFYEGTLAATVAGEKAVPPAKRGLLQATFLRELSGGPTNSACSGVTGTTGKSTQQYGVAPPMNVDRANPVVVFLRLVGERHEPFQQGASRGARSTAIPPPV